MNIYNKNNPQYKTEESTDGTSVKHTLQVERSIEDLHGVVSRLITFQENLKTRLKPVMRPECENDLDSDNKSDPTCACAPIATKINDVTSNLERIYQDTVDMLNRLEI